MEQIVDVLEPAGDAGHAVFLLGQLHQILESLVHQHVELLERRGDALLRDGEQGFLGLFHDDAQIVGGVVGERLDGCRRADELAQDGGTLDDF